MQTFPFSRTDIRFRKCLLRRVIALPRARPAQDPPSAVPQSLPALRGTSHSRGQESQGKVPQLSAGQPGWLCPPPCVHIFTRGVACLLLDSFIPSGLLSEFGRDSHVCHVYHLAPSQDFKSKVRPFDSLPYTSISEPSSHTSRLKNARCTADRSQDQPWCREKGGKGT